MSICVRTPNKNNYLRIPSAPLKNYKNNQMKKILLFTFTLISILKLNAQQCATDEYDAFMKRTNPQYAAERQKMEQQIYSIIKNKQNNPNARIAQNDCQQPSGVFTIPVVVHVIHKGEAIGTGFNISDVQIIEAVRGMNERWRREMGDGVDLEIQFALAVRDTNDNVTNGITRYDGRVFPNYTANGSYSVGAPGASAVSIMDSTVWDRSKYINIWVVDLRDACGYASLGIAYSFFMGYNCMDYNSITLAHEMGHAFGLHHTFAGDGSGGGLDPSTQCPTNSDCLLDGDWVCDTPPHKKDECSTTSCATSGDLQNSFKNYMSYCGSRIRFTQGQKDRVRTFLYSDYFWSLVMSDALMPVATPLEVGIVSVENNLTEPVCNGFIPKIKIKNSGNATITTLKVDTYIDGSFYQTTTINTSLIKNNTQTYSLQTINFNSAGQHDLYFSITEINGNTDDYSSLNNQICNDILVRSNLFNKYCLDFENTNSLGIISMNNQITPPTISNISGCSSTNGTKSLSYLSFNNNIKYYSDYFYLPYLNLDSAYQVYLIFDRSYKKGFKNTEPNISFDFLGDCDSSTIVRYGLFIPDFMVATVDGYDSINPWVPTQCSDWKKDSIDLKRPGIYNRIGEKVLTKVNIYKSNNSLNKSQNLYLDNFCIRKRYKIDLFSNPSDAGYLTYLNGYGVYDEGQSITVSASANSCYIFKNWSENGNIVSVNPEYTIVVSRNRNLVANYDKIQTNVLLSVNSVSMGNAVGNGTYRCDTFITIKGLSKAGYSFKNWTDSTGNIVSTDSIYTIYIAEDRILLTANFKRTSTFDISLESVPLIGGNIFGAGTFKKDSTITVTATQNLGYVFNGWTEECFFGECNVSNNPNYTFQVTKDRHLKANFVLGKKLTLNMNYLNGGTVTGAGYYVPNINVDVSATANPCYDFVNWTENGNLYSAARNTIVQMTSDRTLTANFVPKRYNINLAANPTNGGTVTGAGNFACDSSLTVKAKVKTGYKFTNWTEGANIVSTDSNYTFLIAGARSLKANFSLVTGIKQSTINEISKIYPNPANEILQIEIRSKQNTSFTLNIIDMKGSLLETKTINNTKGNFNTSFDVSKLAKGNYLLNLYDEDGMASYKFVVQ